VTHRDVVIIKIKFLIAMSMIPMCDACLSEQVTSPPRVIKIKVYLLINLGFLSELKYT
jgi:hypothetical protein